MNIKKLRGDQVLIDPEIIQEVKTNSGIIIDKDSEMDEAFVGTVVAVGQGKRIKSVPIGYYPIDLSVGDKVMFRYGKPLIIDGKTYSLVLESDCILII